MRIVLPVETIVRELKGKLWLALNLLDEGHEVVFGELSSIKQGLDVIQPDVFFRTSTVYTQSKLRQNKILEKNGARIVVLDTEGGAFKTARQYRERRLHQEMLPTVDRFFAWGNRSASVVETTGGLTKGKTVITGNPRFDVLQTNLRHIYEKEASEIKNEFGEFLLINTNFGRVNPHVGSDEVPDDSPEGKILKKFIELCFRLNDAFPDLTVIVRPHPGENHTTYETKFDNTDGIAVKHYGDVRSWIYGCTAVIHNNCTTGIESSLMEQPVYAYTPTDIEREHTHLSNAISQKVTTIEELISEIETVQEEDRFSYPIEDEKKQKIKEYIHNVDCSATQRIVEEVNQLDGDWTGSQEIKVPIKNKIKRLGVRNLGVDTTESLIGAVTGRDYGKFRQKFPQLTKQELINEVSRFDSNISLAGLDITQFESLGYVYYMVDT